MAALFATIIYYHNAKDGEMEIEGGRPSYLFDLTDSGTLPTHGLRIVYSNMD